MDEPTACPKCGGKRTYWGGTQEPFCHNWKCWPVEATLPELIESGYTPLEAELAAFGRALQGVLDQHGSFIAHAVEAENPKAPALLTLSLFMTVISDIMWQGFASLSVGGDARTVAAMYSQLWMQAVAGAPARQMVIPPGTTLQ